MNRRQLLTASAAGLGSLALGAPLARLAFGSAPTGAAAQRRLRMPPLLDATEGRVTLTAQTGTSNFLGRSISQTAGYNQAYLGPTVRVQNGTLNVRLANQLAEPVSWHWHGLLVPGDQDGGPHSAVAAGREWDTSMQVNQRPATLWYHSHVHGGTARHIYSGLAGVLQVSDGRDDQRGLPSTYGVDDLTLIVQDRRFDETGRMIYSPSTTDVLNGFSGPQILINGQANGVAPVPPGIVRLRLLNASNARIYTLNFDDRRPMHIVATDGGYTMKPMEVFFVRLAPGERVEVLVDFSNGDPAPTLMSSRALAMRIVDFAVDSSLKPRITKLPTDVGAEPFDLAAAPILTRRFNLNVGGSSTDAAVGVELGAGVVGASDASSHDAAGHNHGAAAANGQVIGDFGINGRTHDMSRIDNRVQLGTVERWVIGGGGQIEHPFHVHGVHFRVVTEAGGSNPRPENRGWKDVVLVTGETEIMVRFDHPAMPDHPYMYHCHILEHEDAGMMGQFTVT